MAQRIGVINANDMLVEAQLDGGIYNVGISWNETGQFWSMSIRDVNFSVLASGIAMVPNWPLLKHVRQPEFPPGEIFVEINAGKKIDRDSFINGTANIFYVTVDDMSNAVSRLKATQSAELKERQRLASIIPQISQPTPQNLPGGSTGVNTGGGNANTGTLDNFILDSDALI